MSVCPHELISQINNGQDSFSQLFSLFADGGDNTREALASLAFDLNPRTHATAFEYLCNLLDTSPELNTSILDCISNLHIPSSLFKTVQEKVLDLLESADPDHLPVYIKFLLYTITDHENCVHALKLFREKLDFSDFQQLDTNVPKSIIIESIKVGLRFQKLAEAEYIKILSTEADLKQIDVILLIVLYSLHPKKVSGILENKVKDGTLKPSLLGSTISEHKDGLLQYFADTLDLAGGLLRSSTLIDDSQAQACKEIFESWFSEGSLFIKQEITAQLVTYIGSGIQNEVNISLNILHSLAKINSIGLAHFAEFIKQLLNCWLFLILDCESWAIPQVRTLFNVFAELCGAEPKLFGELTMFVRKKMTHKKTGEKRVGVLASICLVKRTATLDQGLFEIQSLDNANNLEESVRLLNSITRLCSQDVPCLELLFDELSLHLGGFHPCILDWVNTEIVAKFEGVFLVDIDSLQMRPANSIDLALEYGLEESSCAVNLYPLVQEAYQEEQACRNFLETGVKVALLAPLFKLIATYHFVTNSCCDSYLYQPLLVYKDCSLTLSTKNTLLSTLYYAINYFIEQLNAFGSSFENLTIVGHVFSRIEHIIHLEKMLLVLILSTPTWHPIGTVAAPLKQAKSKGKGKGKAQFVGNYSTLSQLRSSFRTLDFAVLALLQFDCIDAVPPTFQAKTVNFSVIKFLLQDLVSKLESRLILQNVVDNLANDDFFANVTMLLPSLCDIANRIALQVTTSDTFDETQKECFYLVLQAFSAVFTWAGFKDGVNEKLLTSILLIFSQGEEDFKTLQQESFGFFQKFIAFSQDLSLVVSILKLLETIADLDNGTTRDLASLVRDHVKQVLRKEWDCGKHVHLEYLLSRRFGYDDAEQKITVVEYHVAVMRALLQGDIQVLEKNWFMTDSTFSIYFKVLFTPTQIVLETLVSLCTSLSKSTLQIELLERITGAFCKCLDLISKKSTDKSCLSSCLKKGKAFMDAFIKQIPIVDKSFTEQKDRIAKLLKQLQKATRILQAACSDLKASGLGSGVPGLKRTLEKYIYEVKRLFAENGVADALIIGNLKHKTITGEQVPSQIVIDYEERPNKKKKVVDVELGWAEDGRKLSCTQVASSDEEDELDEIEED